MSNELGPLDIDCDAPPYVIVRACARIGLVSPEDVRWCRLCHLPASNANEQQRPQSLWQISTGANRAPARRCPCGGPLPRLNGYTFHFNTGEEFTCVIGQCSRCRTILWDDARPDGRMV